MSSCAKGLSVEEFYEFLKKSEVIDEYVRIGAAQSDEEIYKAVDRLIYERLLQSRKEVKDVTVLLNNGSMDVILSYGDGIPEDLVALYNFYVIDFMSLP